MNIYNSNHSSYQLSRVETVVAFLVCNLLRFEGHFVGQRSGSIDRHLVSSGLLFVEAGRRVKGWNGDSRSKLWQDVRVNPKGRF